jgi:hypothetical protein
MGLPKVISPSGALPNVISLLAAPPERFSHWKKYEKVRYYEERTFFMAQLNIVRREWLASTARPSYMHMFFETQERFRIDDLEGAYPIGMMAVANLQEL